jgi:GNAT superfamily N-acetyltransferase
VTGDVVIREARAEDAEGFVRAHESAWDATIGAIVGKSLDDLAPFEARLELYRTSAAKVSEHARIWVAERSGEIVGIAVALRERPESVELRDLYVAPSAWGSGIAVQLIDAAIGSVEAAAREAFLWVGEANARARRFYVREGWIPDGASRASPLGLTELRYRKSLEL